MTSYVITLATSAGLTFSIAVSAPQIRSSVLADVAIVERLVYEGSSVYGVPTIAEVVSPTYTTIARINESRDLQPNRSYPRFIEMASGVVVAATIVSAFVGYFSPGPITGLGLPLAATLWWVLYRLVLRYDRQVSGQG
jgi:hypothetical protein